MPILPLRLCTLAITLVASLGVSAHARTPLPQFTGERVIVADVPDQYRSLNDEIARVEQSSRQTYYVVVIQSSGSGPWATRDYVQELYESWRSQAERSGAKLDPNRSVVIVLAVENRQLGIHAGVELQRQYGLEGQAIDRNLVAPAFIPYAKSGDYMAGLRSLIAATEKWIATKDETARREREQAAAREAEIQRSAEATLAASKSLLQEAREELAAKQQAEMNVQEIAARVDKAAGTLAEAEKLVATNAAAALAQAGQGQQQLQAAMTELRQLAASQAKVAARLDRAEEELEKLDDQLLAQSRQGLNTEAAQQRVDALWATLEDAQANLARDPKQAEAAATSLEDQLRQAGEQVALIPMHHNEAVAREVFLTRTLPVGGTSLVGLAIAGMFAWRVWRRRQLKARLADELASFRDQVVQLLDRLDALKKRHQLLPFSDQDYTEPMLGATLEVYNQIEDSLAQMRATWLAMMDARQQIEVLLSAETRVGKQELEQAQRLLGEAPKLSHVEAAYQKCVEQLNRLEQAHEQAAPLLTAADEEVVRLRQQLEAIGAAQLSIAPYEGDLQQAVAQIAQARELLRADPIGSRQTVDAARERLAALAKLTDVVLRHVAGTREAARQIEQVAVAAADRRAEGYLLREEHGNPDAILDEARREQEAAQAALNDGKVDAAGECLQRAEQATHRAREAIERQVAAKAYCETELPVRQAESRRLREGLVQAQSQQRELEQSFAAASWSAVATHVQQAQRLLDVCDPLLAEAAAQSALDVQNYFRAANHVEHVANQQRQAASLLEAVGTRLAELRALRDRTLGRRNQVEEQARQVQDFVARQERLVRQAARQRLDAARQEQQQALEQMGLAAPDWGAAAAQLDRAAESYTSALAQAHEDVRAHEQLVAQLNEARLRGNRVNELLRANTADRPRAAQRFQAGWQSLERIARESQQPQADWAQLLGLLKEAMQDFEKAEQFAQEDIRLAQQAAAALADAERAYHAARTFYSHGVSAEAGSAGTRLSQAQGQLAAQAYEQAIELAAQAEQTARGACEEAQRQVDRKLRQQEEERRRREQLAAQAAAAAAASLASQFAQAQPASPPAVAPTSSAPAAPPSTWPATSSQSSWSSSSSQSSW